MKILVTGGAGFIGSHIAESYLAAGHHVEIVDDLSMGSIDNLPSGAIFHKLDIRSEAFSDLIREGAFDAINHHAAHMELRVSVDKPMHDADINVLGSVRLFESARRAGVGHIIVASTVAVLGEFRTIPATEEHPTQPIAPYGVSKRSMELYADYYRITHGMSISTLRYTNVYGPRQNPNGESGVIAIFLERFLDGRTPIVHGDGGQERDYVHVHDVARANVFALEHRLNATYHVCTNTAASVNDVVRHLRDALGTDAAVEHGPAKAGDPPRTRGSYDAFNRATGWRPEVPLAEGIRDTAAWFRERH